MQQRKQDYDRFRAQYPDFYYHSYHYELHEDALELSYHFEIKDLGVFRPTWRIAVQEGQSYCMDVIEELVFSLGMVELISYWKITCSPRVHILPRKLSATQLDWWKKLSRKGLGEFFYTNGITAEEDFMTLLCPMDAPESRPASQVQAYSATRVLVPIGGGKDSAVSLSLLADCTRFGYIINPRKATLDTAQVAGIAAQTIVANRALDANMLALNRAGYLNGHTPFSAMAAFSAVLAGYLNGIGFVALSNEGSANEATVSEGDVNHQYSKSFEFEADFRSYEAQFIRSGVNYFSLLRPLSELQIAAIFAKLEPYHAVFRSCNAGSKEDIWCAACPKCLFVAIILAPFLEYEAWRSIFGKDLLAEEALQEDFDKLIGLLPEKPFECVGSREEVNLALQMTLQQYRAENRALPILLARFAAQVGEKIPDTAPLHALSEEHNLPPAFYARVTRAVEELTW